MSRLYPGYLTVRSASITEDSRMVSMDDFVRNTRVLAVVKTGWSILKDGSTP